MSWGIGLQVGSWRLVEELARGGQGAVFRAVHRESSAQAAVKLLLEADPAGRARFQQEGRLLARLHHPHLPLVIDQGQLACGTQFMVMELLQGLDLGRLVERRGLPSIPETTRILAAVASALHHCHQHGVVHRDVKPQNVLMEERSGRPVLVDFGLAKRDRLRLAWTTQDAASLTQEGEVLGTPAYMPPEQLDPNFGEVGPASDVYGLGATLYFLLTGQPPFQGATVLNLFRALVEEPPPDPRRLSPAVPDRLAKLCLAALAKDPGERPLSAELFGQELADAPRSPRGRKRVVLFAFTGLAMCGAVGLALRPRGDAGSLPPAPPATPAPPAEPSPADSTAEDSIPALIQRAALRREREDFEGALADLDRALRLDPTCDQARLRRAVIRSGDVHDLPGALDDVAQVLARDPTNALALGIRGDALARQGDLEGALAELNRALELAPQLTDMRLIRARVRLALRRELDQAEADCDTCLLRNPGLWATYGVRAKLRYERGAMRDALADLDVLLRQSPADQTSLNDRARVLAHLGRVEPAVADLEQLLRLLPEGHELVEPLRSRIDRLKGLPPDAPGIPRAVEDVLLLGERLLSQGDLRGTTACVNRAEVLDPGWPTVRVLRGELLIRRGERQLGRAELDAAVREGPRLATCWRWRGIQRAQERDLAGALSDLDRAIALAPGEVLGYVSRANVRAELPDWRGASEDLDAALALDPDHPLALWQRAQLRLSGSDRAGARADAERFLRVASPDDPRRADVQACLDSLPR